MKKHFFGAVLRRFGFTRHEHNHRMVYYMVEKNPQ